MKTTTNIWLTVAAALVLAGGLGFFFIMSAVRWDFSSLSKAKYQTNTIEISEKFRNISIKTETEDITFIPSPDKKCRVEFYEHEKVKPVASVQDGTLSVSAKDTRRWYEQISLFSGAPKITVYLPQSDYGSLVIEESTGDISIPGGLTFAEIGIKVSTGDVDCDASSEGPIRIKTGTGHIHAENISAGELDLSVSTGKIEVSSADCRGNMNVSVSTGKTMLKDAACKDLISTGSTGDIALENVTASGTISIKRSTGDVKFDRCDAGELSVITDTGDVTGSLRSEKIFIAESDTGRIEVPETTSGGKCRISTDTGKIIITID